MMQRRTRLTRLVLHALGAIILNANRNDGESGMVQMIAHETAHNLLFGIGSDSPLVLNEPDELYPSPLARPTADGRNLSRDIRHARMCRTCAR